ncbi:MAG: LPS export ABC transporter periplasmic protein LptC [Alphaproteobacteria bacterium]|nr:LPS export ABC transporter periplasmic protein LptC [Alphaproteobacteria bacterium]
MKFVLPLAAVALIALMIGWPGVDGDGDGFRLSIADLAPDADGNLGITRARFAGTDRFDQPFLVTAEHAIQDATQGANGFDVFALETLQADLTMANGTWITISAATGQFERSARILDLVGPISVYTDVGYEIHADQARLDLRQGTVISDGPVQGHGPLGAISASNGVAFSSDTGTLTFTGQVRVTINPKSGG